MKDSPIAEKLSWILGKDGNNLTFYKDADKATWLYCTNTNNGVRVGTNTNKVFTLDASSGYLKNTGTSRYIGIYNSQDWRCYTSATGNSNIAGQTLAFYKKTTTGGYQNYTTSCGSAPDVIVKTLESITVSNVATTIFLEGSEFTFDGTCTATYSVTKNDEEQPQETKTIPNSVIHRRR